MRPRAVLAGPISVLLAACGGERSRLLSEMPAFSGDVRIESRAGPHERVVSGKLRFDRESGRIEFVHGDPPITLSQVGDGPVTKIVEGRSVALETEDWPVFQTVWTAVHTEPDSAAVVERRADGYRIVVGRTEQERQELDVHLVPEPP